MHSPADLVQDMENFDLELQNRIWFNEVLPSIECADYLSKIDFDIGPFFGREVASKCLEVIQNSYLNPDTDIVTPQQLQMKIKLTTDTPIYTAPRKLSYVDKEVVRDMVNELLQKRHARPSHSEYASPIVLVKKKNGENRLCIDYRAINRVMVKDNFPLPLIDDCVDFLGHKACFTIIDLKNGFNQVIIEN